MKNVLLGLLLIMTGAQANATSLKRFLDSNLTHFRFAQGSPLAEQSIYSGHLQIDFFDHTATLSLYPEFHCPAGRACAQVMPAPVIVQLPKVGEITFNSCGARVFRFKQDSRPVDGILQEITVTDNTTNRCLTFVALPATEVRLHEAGYNRLGQDGFDYLHIMTGDRLY